MRKLGYIGVVTLLGIAAVSTAGSASGCGSFYLSSRAGRVQFSRPRAFRFMGAVQIGEKPVSNVTQTSTNNIAVVGQVGTQPTTTIKQTGTLNVAHVTQVGPSSNALTIQFGNIESLLANN